MSVASSSSPSRSQHHRASSLSSSIDESCHRSDTKAIAGSSSMQSGAHNRSEYDELEGDGDEDEEDDELMPDVNDPDKMQTIECEWLGCGDEFYELEPLIDHLHTAHAHPINQGVGGGTGRKAAIYACDWVGCNRRGKHQTSKFALVGHLRSHTGEKPFTCPQPECDKSFTRIDALQKHMRIIHQRVILTTKRPPSQPAPSGQPSSKKRKAGRAVSIDSNDGARPGDDDDFSTASVNAAAADEDDADFAFDDEEMESINTHSAVDPTLIAYVIKKAKYAYAIQEHEGLCSSVEVCGIREMELRSGNEDLLKAILRKEIGSISSLADATLLESLLTQYDHTSSV